MAPPRHILFPRHPELRPLVEALHAMAMVDLTEGEPEQGPVGRSWRWAINSSLPLLAGGRMQETAAALAALLDEVGAERVAAAGLGAAPLFGAVLSSRPELRGILLRSHPKETGLRRRYAGSVDPGHPYWLVDDVVHTGGSALRLADRVVQEGGTVAGVVCIFIYEWGDGYRALRERGFPVHALAKVRAR